MRGVFFVVVIVALLAHAAHAADYSKYNARVGKKFLEEKAKEEGVTKTASGLLYKVLHRGDSNAEPPGPNDQVKVHYRGTLINGKVYMILFSNFHSTCTGRARTKPTPPAHLSRELTKIHLYAAGV